MAAPCVTLNNGVKLPSIGLGTYISAENPEQFLQAVSDAVDVGYRHFDTAYFYDNEELLGKALNKKIKEGTIKREELFVTSKLWSDSHSREAVVKMCKKSNENLGLGYIDLFLIHWPFAFKEGGDSVPVDKDGNIEMADIDYVDTWKEMEQCVKLGLAKSIGVSNFNSEQIDRVLAVATIKPVCNQVEYGMFLNQKKLIQFCKERDIVIVGHSPFSRPDWKQEGKPKSPLEDPQVIAIAKKYNKEPSQVILRYLNQNGAVLIPKSVTKSRIESNINIFDFNLSEEDKKVLDGFNCNFRVYNFSDAKNDKYYPFHIDY